MWTASDEALVAGMANGDADAALVFVRRFQARVYGLAMASSHDAASADEIAQEAFVRAWRYAMSFDARRGTVAAWLLTITRNVALDQLARRTRRREHEMPAGELVDTIGETAAGLGDPADGQADRTVLLAALAELPAEQREAIVAAAFYGWTAREMSESWSLPLGTVKTRLRLAMQKLRTSVTEVSP